MITFFLRSLHFLSGSFGYQIICRPATSQFFLLRSFIVTSAVTICSHLYLTVCFGGFPFTLVLKITGILHSLFMCVQGVYH
jgi:hypothetical protein